LQVGRRNIANNLSAHNSIVPFCFALTLAATWRCGVSLSRWANCHEYHAAVRTFLCCCGSIFHLRAESRSLDLR
jgi:hypothetical protein